MGCDIHPMFETRQPDGTWKLTFPATPAPWWYEQIVLDHIEDGNAITVFGPPTEEEIEEKRRETNRSGVSDETLIDYVLEKKLVAHLKSLTLEEIIEKYSHCPDFAWEFFPTSVCDKYGYPDINSRSYSWFAAVSPESVRHRFERRSNADQAHFEELAVFETRGIPDDCCSEIASDIKRYGSDGHSHSWLMVSEILSDPRMDRDDFAGHMGWLKKHIADPDNTRMVFYFDN
jgi:hypothetical protein